MTDQTEEMVRAYVRVRAMIQKRRRTPVYDPRPKRVIRSQAVKA